MSTSLHRNSSARSTSQKKKTDGKASPIELLEARCVLAAPQLLDPFTAAVSLRVGTALHIPLNGFDADGNAITFSVTSDNPLIEASVPQGNRSVRFTLNHESADGFPTDPAFTDDFTVELLEDIAPNTAGRFANFVESGFYDGLTFHRLADGFAAQFGDPSGDGTGGTGNPIQDEFSKYSRHTSAGLLSTAKSIDDTFDTQAFLTQGNEDSTRFLDFNHTVFGVVKTFGDTINFDDVAVMQNPVTGDPNFPVSPVTIVDAELFVDEENGVLRLYVSNDVPVGTTANLTLTLTDSNGEFTTQNVQVVIEEDFSPIFGDWDDQPFFDPNPQPQVTDFETPVTFNLNATDIEGDGITFSEASVNEYNSAQIPYVSELLVDVNPTTGEVTVTPTGQLAGVFSILVKVEQTVGGSGADFQVVPIIVNPPAPDGGVSFVSDSGVPGDGITNVNNTGGVPLEFRVEGQYPGVTIQLLADGEMISEGPAAADGSLDFQLTGNDLFEDGDYVITARFVATIPAATGRTADFEDFFIVGAETAPINITIDTQPPVFISQPNTVATFGQPYSYDVSTDSDGEAGVDHVLITYPEGMTIDPGTGLIQWTPTPDQAGDQDVVVRVIDAAGNFSDQPYTIFVNTPPILLPVDPQTVDEETLLEVQLAVQDPDAGQVFTFELVGTVPDGAAVDNTGRFTFTPSEPQGPSNFVVTVRATDNLGGFGDVDITIQVNEVSQPPVVEAIDSTFVLQGSSLVFNVVATDVDLPAQTLIYSLDPGAPVGASIDPNTGQFTYNAPIDQPLGEVVVTIRVSDGVGVDALSASTSVTIEVVDDLPPVFLDQQTQFSTKASEPLFFDVLAVDPDPQPVDLLYSLEPGAPDFVSIDPNTGRVTVTTTRQTPTQTADFIVRVTEVGDDGPTATKTFSVEITDPPNLPPEFPEQPMDFTTQASIPLTFTVAAVDPDEVPVPLVFSLDPGTPDFVSIDPATGEVTVATTRHTPPQTLEIVVRVTEDSSDALSVTKTFSIEITDPPNLPPVFPDQTMQFSTKASETLFFGALAEDPTPLESDLIFSLDPATPDFVTIDPDTGLVTVTTTRQTPPQTIEIIVQVTEISDDQLTAMKTFTVEITDPPNLVPEFPEQPSEFTTQASFPLTFDVTAIDPDEVPVPLVYSLEPGTPDFVSIDPATGEVTVATTRQTPAQTLEIVVRATEDRADALSATKTFTVEITAAPNDPPVYPDQQTEYTTEVGKLLTINVLAADPDPEQVPLVYSLEPGTPGIVSINGTTGQVTVTTTRQTLPQTIQFEVRATETTGGLSTTLEFTVELTPSTNQSPIIGPVAKQTVRMGTEIKFGVGSSDPDIPASPLVHSLSDDAPEEASIDPFTGEVTFSATLNTVPGIYRFDVHVAEDEAEGLSATATVEVEVTAVDFRSFLGPGFSRFGPNPLEIAPSIQTDPTFSSLVGLFRSTSTSSSSSSSTEGLLNRTAEGFSESPFNNITYGADTGLGRSAPREEGGEEESDGEKPKEENLEEESEGVVPAQATEPVDETGKEGEAQGDASVEEEDKTPKAAVWDDRLIDWATAQHWAPGQDTFARTMNASVNRSRTADHDADPYDIDLEPLVAPHMTVGPQSDTGFNKQPRFESLRGSGASIVLPAPGTEDESTSPVVEETPVSDEVATAAAASMAFYMPLLVTDLPEAKKSRSRLRKWLGEGD